MRWLKFLPELIPGWLSQSVAFEFYFMTLWRMFCAIWREMALGAAMALGAMCARRRLAAESARRWSEIAL